MATFVKGIQFHGTIGGLTGYSRPGSDKVFLRENNPHSKKKMYKDPAFELSMQNANEFGGRSMAGSALRKALHPIDRLKAPGFNIISKGNSLFKTIQLLDTSGKRGERSVICSRFKPFLEGFNLNPVHSLSDILLPQIHHDISRKQGTVNIELPELVHGLSLKLPWNAPMYRLILHLGVLADVLYQEKTFVKTSINKLPGSVTWYSNWQYARQTFPAQKVVLQLKKVDLLTDNMSLILAAGIEMGTPVTDMLVEPAAHKGSAKILAVA